MAIQVKSCPICRFSFSYEDSLGEFVHCGDESCTAVYLGTASDIDDDEGDTSLDPWDSVPAPDDGFPTYQGDDEDEDEVEENPIISEYERYRAGIPAATSTSTTRVAGFIPTGGSFKFRPSTDPVYQKQQQRKQQNQPEEPEQCDEHEWTWSGNKNGMVWCKVCDCNYSETLHGPLPDLGNPRAY